MTRQGKPVFIRHRTEAEITEAQEVDSASLIDPATDDRACNRKSGWFLSVLYASCCVAHGAKVGEGRGEYNGWFCPCHGSHYDTSGRIRKGSAPANLAVLPYEFLSDALIKIG